MRLDTVMQLLEEGHNPNTANTVDGQTPLMAIAGNETINHKNLVKELIEEGISSNEAHDMAEDYLTTYVDEDIPIAIILLEAGADPNLRCKKGRTALLLAAQMGKADLVQLLLYNGANPKISDNKGITPLMYAMLYGHSSVVKCLTS
jgi:ankyrin repeat protein